MVPSPSVTSTLPVTTSIPRFDHIFVVLEENRSYGQIIGSPSAPYINSLAEQFGLATNFSAVSHPSTPNYLALIGGSTFGIQMDCPPSVCPVDAHSIVDKIEAAGKTWKAYLESMPLPCDSSNSGNYAVRHDPFVYFTPLRNDIARCGQHVVPFSALADDIAQAETTPNFVWISPNMCSDMHDCAIDVGDQWLEKELGSIFSSPAWNTQSSVLFLLWDEDDNTAGNHIPAVVIGSNVKPGFKSGVSYNHYSLLRTIELAWGLAPFSSHDANATPMADFWK